MTLAQMERIAHRLAGETVPVRWWNHRRVNRRWGRAMITNWCLGRDLNLIAGVETSNPWKPWMDEIRSSGVPTMIGGGLTGLVVNPVTLNQATVTGGATELAMIPTAILPIAQNVQSGTGYHLFAGGTSTTAATPGTYTLVTRIGSAGIATVTSPLLTPVSSAFTPLASMTVAPWTLDGDLVIRGSGTANTAAAGFAWSQTSVASAAAPGPSSATSAGNLGGVSASFDSTAAAGSSLWVGVTHATSTTNTWIPQLVIWASWN
jgi:hypothetical protein